MYELNKLHCRQYLHRIYIYEIDYTQLIIMVLQLKILSVIIAHVHILLLIVILIYIK
nr:MAG TPA: hypothetical protein [Crassvirales sp.]